MGKLGEPMEDKINAETCKKLLEDQHGELEAITQYEEHIKTAKYEDVKETLTHIRKEEEHHADELNKLIQKYCH